MIAGKVGKENLTLDHYFVVTFFLAGNKTCFLHNKYILSPHKYLRTDAHSMIYEENSELRRNLMATSK